MRGGDGRPTVGWITSDKIKLYFAGKNVKDASIWIRQEDKEIDNSEIGVLREAIADIANNMEAADGSYMSGFIEDLRKAMKK